jgi:CHASE2 domain-containing sensor protein
MMIRSLMSRVFPFRFPKNLFPKSIAPFRDPRVRLRFEVGLAIGLAVGLVLTVVLYSGVLSTIDSMVTDLVYRPIPPSGKVAIVAIDQKSLDHIGTWPWPRSILAGLLNRLSGGSPAVIVFDVGFPQPSPDDGGFAAAIQKAGNVILSTDGVEAAAYPQQLLAFPQFDVLLLPTEKLGTVAAGFGHRVLRVDPDGILRRVPAAIETAGVRNPALGIAAAQAYLGAQEINYDLPHRREWWVTE